MDGRRGSGPGSAPLPAAARCALRPRERLSARHAVVIAVFRRGREAPTLRTPETMAVDDGSAAQTSGSSGWCFSEVRGTGRSPSIWASLQLAWRRCCAPSSYRPRPQSQAAGPTSFRSRYGGNGAAASRTGEMIRPSLLIGNINRRRWVHCRILWDCSGPTAAAPHICGTARSGFFCARNGQ